MQNGLKRKIKIYFPRENSSGWLGGVNYFKNLLFALSLVNNNEIIPYLARNNPKELFEHANKFHKIDFAKHYLISKIFPTATSLMTAYAQYAGFPIFNIFIFPICLVQKN